MKAVQYFSDHHLERSRELSPDQITRFLDDFRRLHGRRRSPSKLISMKVPEDLLNAFRTKADLRNTPYQTQIKVLMSEWVTKPTD